MYFVIKDYFAKTIFKNETMVNKIIMFFASYIDVPYEGNDFNRLFNDISKSNFSTMRSDLEDFKKEVIDVRTKKSITIQNEILRSHQEVEIANFLYLNNIDYDYEPMYPYNIEYSNKPYTPDFIIYQGEKVAYIEHFGITQDGENNRYSQEQIEKYKKSINDKILLHKRHNTTLIYTFSVYNDKRPLTEHLKEALESKEFELITRSSKEVMEKLIAGEENKYIIIDEYQDISKQRFDLTKALSDVKDAKIIAVGDDWQSIYAFSGSDISLFTKFEEKMGYAKLLKIVNTYRNSQDVIDIAGNFIQKNTEQITKRLISSKRIIDPVVIYTYDSTSKGVNQNRRSGANYAMAHAIEIALSQLIEYKKQEGKQPGTILLLGRYSFDGDRLERSGLFEYIKKGSRIKSVKYPKLDITFMTVHSSKG